MARSLVDADRDGDGSQQSLMCYIVRGEIHEMSRTSRVQPQQVHADLFHGNVKKDLGLVLPGCSDLLGETNEADGELELVDAA